MRDERITRHTRPGTCGQNCILTYLTDLCPLQTSSSPVQMRDLWRHQALLCTILCKLLIALVRRWPCRPDSPGQVRSGQAMLCYVRCRGGGKGDELPFTVNNARPEPSTGKGGTCPRPDTVLHHQQLPLFLADAVLSCFGFCCVYSIFYILCYIFIHVIALCRSLPIYAAASLCDAPGVSAAVRHARQLRRHDAVLRGPSPRSRR